MLTTAVVAYDDEFKIGGGRRLHNAKMMPALVHVLRQSAVGQSFVYSVPTVEKPHLPQFKDLEISRNFSF
jgi:hypothetical protein